jgi:hypothetical protein
MCYKFYTLRTPPRNKLCVRGIFSKSCNDNKHLFAFTFIGNYKKQDKYMKGFKIIYKIYMKPLKPKIILNL